MAEDAVALDLVILDRIVIEYAEADGLIEPAAVHEVEMQRRQSREKIETVRWFLCQGQITSARKLLEETAASLATDQKLLFWFHKQTFIELLRAGLCEEALVVARTSLESTSLNAYPEAYAEFKKIMLALLFNPGDASSPVASECEVERRTELAAQVATAMRSALQANNPLLVQALCYLVSLHDRYHNQHNWTSPVENLTSNLISKTRDPALSPSEQIHEAPLYQEAVVQCLAQAVGISRQEAVDSLRCTHGDLQRAFQNELGRMRTNLPVLDDLVHEYCLYRGLVAHSGAWPRTWDQWVEDPSSEMAATLVGTAEGACARPEINPLWEAACKEPSGTHDIMERGLGTIGDSFGGQILSAGQGTGEVVMEEDKLGKEKEGRSWPEDKAGMSAEPDVNMGVGGGEMDFLRDQAELATPTETDFLIGADRISIDQPACAVDTCQASNGEGLFWGCIEPTVICQTSIMEERESSCSSPGDLESRELSRELAAESGCLELGKGQSHRRWKGRPPGFVDRWLSTAPPDLTQTEVNARTASATQECPGPHYCRRIPNLDLDLDLDPPGHSKRLKVQCRCSSALPPQQLSKEQERQWRQSILSKYERVLEIQALVKEGRTENVLAALQQLDPSFLTHHPQLLFELQQAEFFRLIGLRDLDRALTIAQSVLGPLAARHPRLLPILKASVVALARAGEPLVRLRSPDELAAGFQVALATSLGVPQPRLVKLLDTLLASHSCWFQQQLCNDEFAATLNLAALKQPSVGPTLVNGLLPPDAPGSGVPGPDGKTLKSFTTKVVPRRLDEVAIVQLMEFMAVSRFDAIELLVKHNGNVDMVFASILGL